MKKGAVVTYCDPYVPDFQKMGDHILGLKCEDLTTENDCILIGTNHDCFDWDLIRTNSALIVDTRGVYRGRFNNIVRS